MTSVLFNSPSNNHSSYPTHHNHQFLNPNYHQPPSSSLSTHLFLNSNGIFTTQLHQQEDTQPQEDHQAENNHGKGFEFPTWNKNGNNHMNSDSNQMKWMSPKMRVKLKMKKSDDDHVISNISYRQVTNNIDHEETYDSNSNSIPIRVCSDCNTTKTPLWRSGPQGPKSLCNASGIRQRKARKAAAMEDNINSNSNLFTDEIKVRKISHKDHKKPHNNSKGQVPRNKKRKYFSEQIMARSLSSPRPRARKNCVEEYVVSLSNKLRLYHVFPEDEKEAAILLMALSCGYSQQT